MAPKNRKDTSPLNVSAQSIHKILLHFKTGLQAKQKHL